MKKLPAIICPECTTEFIPKRSWQRFCSVNCRWDNWNRLHPRVRSVKAVTITS